jgi:hypothetical protein
VAETREDIERKLQQEFPTDNPRMFQSTSEEPERSEKVTNLVVARDQRAMPPLTLSKYVIDENPDRVEWEREVRAFLLALPNPEAGHTITAPMIYEWATQRSIADDVKAEGVDPNKWQGGARSGSANAHLRHINWVLKEYFGQSYETRIAGRKVGKAYTVRRYFRLREKMPANITLWPDWKAGTLDS